MRIVVLLVLALGAAARPAHACSRIQMTIFESVDAADEVVMAKAASQRSFDVITRFKGPAAKTVAVHETGTTCDWTFATGDTGLVFVSRGLVFAFWSAHPAHDVVGADAALVAAVAAWSQATSPAERAAVLVDVIEKPGSLELDAATMLRDSPELLNALTAAQRDRLTAARGSDRVPEILARLGIADADHVRAHQLTRLDQIALEVRRLESVTSTDELARIIEAKGSSAITKTAAYSRCDRLRGDPHPPYAHTDLMFLSGPHDQPIWPRQAALCRDGKL